MLNCGTKYLIS